MIQAYVRLEDKKENVFHWEEKTRLVDTIPELKQELMDRFGVDVSKAQPLYVDKKDGSRKKVGWAKNTWEKYDDTGKRFPATYWIEVREVKDYEF